MKTEDEPPNPG